MVPETYVKAVLDIWSDCREKTDHSVEGNCMSPLIREGDSIVIDHGREDITAGDVVVARISGRYNVQRVIGRAVHEGEETFLLKGDQSSHYNESLHRRDIIGKVVEVSGSNGHLYLDSFSWRILNYILSLRSRVSLRCAGADSLFWKGTASLFTLRKALLPAGCSLSLIPFRTICFLSGKWFYLRKRFMRNRKGGIDGYRKPCAKE